LPATSTASFTFATYGDSASGNPPTGFINVQNAINRTASKFAVLLGDNVYNTGTHAEWDYRLSSSTNSAATTWNKNHIDYFAYGNHDVSSNNGQPALDNYSNPVPVLGKTSPVAGPVDHNTEKNYSFDHGLVHFVVIDSNQYTSASEIDKIYDWAENDLASSTQPWKFLVLHHPIESVSFTSTGPGSTYFRKVFDRLKPKGLDVVLQGHAHAYERSFPVTGYSGSAMTFTDTDDNDYQKGAGVVLLTSGLGGKDTHGGATTTNDGWAHVRTSSGTNPSADFSFTKVDVTAGQLTFTQVKASDDSVMDTFTITSGMSNTNVQPASLVAGSSGNVTVSFRTSTSTTADGKIVVTLPTSLGSGFVFDSGGNTGVTSISGFDGITPF